MIPELGRSPGEGIDYPLQYSWASLVAQLVKSRPAMRAENARVGLCFIHVCFSCLITALLLLLFQPRLVSTYIRSPSQWPWSICSHCIAPVCHICRFLFLSPSLDGVLFDCSLSNHVHASLLPCPGQCLSQNILLN